MADPLDIELDVSLVALASLGPELVASLNKATSAAIKRSGISKAIGDSLKKDLGATFEALPAALISKVGNKTTQLRRAMQNVGRSMGQGATEGFTSGISDLDVALQKELTKTTRESRKTAESLGRSLADAAANELKATQATTRAATKQTKIINNAKIVTSNNEVAKSENRVAEATQNRINQERKFSTQIERSGSIRDTNVANKAINLTKAQVEAARLQRQVTVAEEQQEQKRKTLRLQRFNALFLQLTQAGFSKIRDARRLAAQQEIQQQVSNDHRSERQLRETLSRREQIIQRSIQRSTRLQQSSTTTLLQQQASSGVIGAARGVSPIGASLRSLALIGGGALSIRAIFRSAQDFLANFRRLGALTGATDEQMKKLRATSIALGNDLSLPGVSAADAAESLTRLVQAGFSVDQAVGAAKGTLLLARNQLIDFSEAAQFTGSAINSFGIDASKALAIVDVAQRSLVSGGGQSFTELSQAIQQSGAVFSQFFGKVRGGQGAFEDLNIALDILAKNGLRGSDAGTSLKTFLLGLTGSSEQARKVIDRLGKEIGVTTAEAGSLFFDAAGNVRPFLEIIKNLRTSLSDFTQEGRLAILKQVFGTDAFRAASIFIGQTDEQLAAFEETIRTAAGSSEKLGRAVNQGLRAAFDNFSSVIETAGILLIEKIDIPAGRVVNTFTNLISKLIQGQGAWEAARAGLAGIAVALGAILAAKGAVEVLQLAKGAVIGLASPAKLAALAFLAIGGAIGVGLKQSDAFREAMGNLVTFAREEVLAPLEGIGRRIRTAIFGEDQPARGAGLNAAQRETLPDAIGAIEQKSPVFDALARVINGTVIPALEGTARVVREEIIPFIGNLVRFIRDEAVPILIKLGVLVGDVFRLVAFEVSTRLGPAVTSVIDGFTAGFRGLTNEAQRSGVLGFIEDLGRAAGTVADIIGNLFTGNFSGAGRTFVGLVRSIRDAIVGAISGIDFGAIGLTIFKAIGVGARKAGSALTTAFSEPILKGVLAAVAGVLAVAGQIAINFVIGFAKGLQGRADDIGRVIVDVLKIAIPLAITAVTEVTKGAFTALFKAAISGPVGLAVALIAAAFGARLLGRLRSEFFQPFAAQTKATFLTLRGDVSGGQQVYETFLTKQRQVAQDALQLKQRLGGGFFAKFITGTGQAVEAMGRLNGAVGQAALAGISTYFGAWQGGFASLISLAGSAVLALQQLAVGNTAGAILIGTLSAIGFAFGSMSRKAQEATRRVKEFSENLSSAQTVQEGFAKGLEDLARGNDHLQTSLVAVGVQYDSFLTSLTTPDSVINRVKVTSDAIDAIQKTVNEVDVTGFRSQLEALGGALSPSQINSFVSELVRLRNEFDQTGGSNEAAKNLSLFAVTVKTALLDAAAGAEGAGKDIEQVIKDVRNALKEGTLDEALGLSVASIASTLGELRAKGEDTSAALVNLIPPKLETELTLLGRDLLPQLSTALTGSNAQFEAYTAQVLAAADAEELSSKEKTALRILLEQLRGGFLHSGEAADIYREQVAGATRATHEAARQKRLDALARDWDEITASTRNAITQLDIYFSRVAGGAGGTTQEAIDQAIVSGSSLVKSLQSFIEENKLNPLSFLDPTFKASALGSEFRVQFLGGAKQILQDAIDQLPEGISTADARAALNTIIQGIVTTGEQLGIDAGLLSGLFSEEALNAATADISARGAQAAALFRQAVLDALSNDALDLSNLPIGAIPEIDVDLIAKQLTLDKGLPAQASQFLQDNPIAAKAIITDVIKPPPPVIPATLKFTKIEGIPRIRVLANGDIIRNSEGSIVTRPTLSTLAEGGRPEAVIPLTKPARALQLLRASGLADLLLGSTNLIGAGRSVGEGTAVGLNQARGSVAAATAQLAAVVSNTFRSLLGIHSPSTVFERFGREIIDGLVKGLKEGASAAGDAIKGFVDVLLGRVAGGTGGAPGTGFDQLAKAVRDQVSEALREVGSDFGARAEAQSSAFGAIADLTSKDQLKNFKSGFGANTAAGAANIDAVANAIKAAREAIITDVEQGDTAGAQAVLDALRASLSKAAAAGPNARADRANAAAIADILGRFGLGGTNPVGDIAADFARATEELRKVLEAEEQRAAAEAAAAQAEAEARRARNTPPSVANTFVISSPYDPFEIARRAGRETLRSLTRAIQ